MLAKAIENWLTNANELGYQAAFVQALMQEDESVLYVARHRSLEQGKDIATRGPDGVVRAYQLKGGDINIGAWRSAMPELEDLVRMPVRHPSVQAGESRRVFFVTNGRIIDEVMVNIQEFNRARNGTYADLPVLEVLQREDLLKRFLGMGNRVLPLDARRARDLFGIMCADGRDMLDRGVFADVLWQSCFAFDAPRKSDITNAMTMSALMVGASIERYRESNNHYAMFEAWVLAAAAVTRFVALHGEPVKGLQGQVLDLMWREAERALDALSEEVIEREDLLEGRWLGDGGDVYRARATIALGAMASRELVARALDGGRAYDDRVLAAIEKFRKHMWLWGESAIPSFLAVAKYLEVQGHAGEGGQLAELLLRIVATRNQLKADEAKAMPTVYFSAEEVLLNIIGEAPLEKEIVRREFLGQSWSLATLVHWLARRGKRDVLNELWPQIARITAHEFVPEDSEAFWSFETKRGSNRYGHFPAPKSWGELKSEADAVPESAEVWPLWGPRVFYWLLVAPHRMRHPYVTLVDQSQS